MTDVELMKRMLRAVLAANKSGPGVSLSRLQSEYKALTGEQIPHKQMGHASLDTLLHSIPSVVRMERNRTGEMVCFASVSSETAHVAKLVARQCTSKKTGRPQMVNCQMRVKPAAPLILNAKPRTSLRQPDHRGVGRGGGGGGRGLGGQHGDFRQGRDMRNTQSEGKSNQSSNQNKPINQNTPATRKSYVHSERSDKRMTLPSLFQKEVYTHFSRNTQSNPSTNFKENAVSGKPKPHHHPKDYNPSPGGNYNPQKVQGHIREVLNKYSNGFWVSKLPQLYRELYKQDLPSEAIKDLEHWTHICTVEKPCSSNPNELLLYPAKEPTQTPSPVPTRVQYPTSTAFTPTMDIKPQSKPPTTPSTTTMSPLPLTTPSSSPSPPASPSTLSPDLRQKLGELLVKYSNGLWAHALPKLYLDTYKTKLPEHILENLSLLSDFCTIEYPMPDNPKRAILYKRTREEENRNRMESVEECRAREEVGRRLSTQTVPPLLIPREEYPSVLVGEAANTNGVILRYIGEGYSQAQEALEDKMREFYCCQDNNTRTGDKKSGTPLASLTSGQLAAVRTEEDEEVLRAQVTEVMADKVKVYYVDHGFSEVISKAKVFELHEKFFNLPFQATKCQLAGLEPFYQEPAVLKKFESMASGKILLAEILERGQTPLVVLYDTSQDVDVNINAACIKALQDKTLASPLQVNSAYMNVAVRSVCSDGTIYCQLPSRGLAKLTEILEKAEAYFHSQVTSEFLVSRPFCGKSCLARYKGKWSRVEITNLHGSRVLDILFTDLGVQASVEVIELREVPPPFLRDLIAIPPQVVKCCLADLTVRGVGSWTPDAVQWFRDAVLNSTDCRVKIAKLDETKRSVAHVYLFPDKNFQDPARSLNRQMAASDLFKHRGDHCPSKTSTCTSTATLTSTPKTSTTTITPSSNGTKPQLRCARSEPRPTGGTSTPPGTPPPPSSTTPIKLPLLLELPPAGQYHTCSICNYMVQTLPKSVSAAGHNMDIYVSVACHPGHFVVQPWRDMYKLVVLMEEMILYYNKTEEKPLKGEKNQIYAAKVENNWHRVLVKGVLTNGLMSVYELDYGKHELVSGTQLRPLIQEFRQLPFQGITAQLAGVKPRQWSEEASILFRNHVEKKPLVAQLEAVQEAHHPWDRKLTVFLVDTSQEERDIWVHDIMVEFELTKEV
ncbi:tudor domain-containing protein 7B-like [Salvelinus namaycush]|uniref:Tudor domain-containing protein 7B-like n=1 Tax=Salvelinus namaycush TaxID=8040 RepID=A0A8U0TWI8_SALNM|nr:tudor domain-containing protein 7B-like [Salvelinus namaycush]